MQNSLTLVYLVPFSVDNFRVFLNQYFNAELKPYIKSEAIPEDNDGPVKVLNCVMVFLCATSVVPVVFECWVSLLRHL